VYVRTGIRWERNWFTISLGAADDWRIIGPQTARRSHRVGRTAGKEHLDARAAAHAGGVLRTSTVEGVNAFRCRPSAAAQGSPPGTRTAWA